MLVRIFGGAAQAVPYDRELGWGPVAIGRDDPTDGEPSVSFQPVANRQTLDAADEGGMEPCRRRGELHFFDVG